MPDAWPDAEDNDEQALLMTNLDGGPEDSSPNSWPPKSKRRKVTVSTRTALLLLVIPSILFIWILTTWSTARKHPPASESDSHLTESDAFLLNPSFDRSVPPKTRIYRWTVSRIFVPGARENITRTVVNGHSPGPIIQANVHDRILVYLTNGLEGEGTSIHWHGLPLPGTPFYDGAAGISQCPIPPGQTLLYNFTFGGWTGTTWWHGHTAVQHTDGRPKLRFLTLSDVYTTMPANEMLESYLTTHSMETVAEPVPDRVEINGRGGGAHLEDESMRAREDDAHNYTEVRIEPGTTTRLRLIHAGSFAPLRVPIDSHALTIIEADGSAVAPVHVRDLLMQPAQRYSVLVSPESDSGDTFWIRARMLTDRFAYDNPNMEPEARAILRYAGPVPRPTHPPLERDQSNDNETLPAFDEWALRPPNNSSLAHPPPNTDVLSLPFIFSIQRTHELNWRSIINGTSWEIPPAGEAAGVTDIATVYGSGNDMREVRRGVQVFPEDQVIATLEHGQTVDFVITNLDDGEHPFHLHGYAPWLLASGPGRYKPGKVPLETTNPLRRDTFTVPSRGWAVVRIVASNAGYWAFHCHIVCCGAPPADGDAAMIPLPDDIVQQCKMWV
ncbi:multi-copper oxidase [Mycena rebaudengoi]|nr:multi-copper oxidase [Mycena rebaudengoi]